MFIQIKVLKYVKINPLSASVALNIETTQLICTANQYLIDMHSKSIDWFLYEGNTDT